MDTRGLALDGPPIGTEALRVASALLTLAAAGFVIMAGATVWNGTPDDAEPGQPPRVAAWPLLGWLAGAVLAGCAATVLWALLPAGETADDPLDG